jgi:hypothetical protein
MEGMMSSGPDIAVEEKATDDSVLVFGVAPSLSRFFLFLAVDGLAGVASSAPCSLSDEVDATTQESPRTE